MFRAPGTIVPIFRCARLYTAAYGFQQHCAHLQECKVVHYCIWFSALKVLKTICSCVQPYTPEDGHNVAENHMQ